MDHSKKRYCTPFLGVRLFCDCAATLNDCRSNQRYTSSDDTCRCYACLWRTIKYLAMGWCQSGYYFPIPIGKKR